MTLDEILDQSKVHFQKTLQHLKDEYSKLQIGRAHPSLVDSIVVEMYGTMQPLKALANISVSDAKTLSIQPWDRTALVAIEKAIGNSGLGVNPVNTGLALIINMPPMTEERRANVAKNAKALAEEARIGVRSSRQDGITAMKKKKEAKEITEDELFGYEKKMQEAVDVVNGQIDETAKAKEKDIMTI